MATVKDINIILLHQYLDENAKVKNVQRKFKAIKLNVTNEQVKTFKGIIETLSDEKFKDAYIVKTIQIED
ncbi:hypothetical protein AXY37_11185 [Mammaliicoccus lentus]|jgi:hypothetical protein|uniref:DUF1659 domain-containing protein n=1 Tax=Mammaliicoccus lentus TaxID=42858 RepID=A0AAP1RQS4_MAMLE|nr:MULTISPECIES: hypothetical protein [Mammaliicoccus]HBV02787.1 hypothetical protein [Staphylococcus sp.]MBF0749627.1 hypothetical protein [Mammaliicoccus lentus]MBF0795357.1 hypothetical protein [Mammaliicoccus lentus]MBF0841070.1 hypothetical protein [Mammaliicoccus lentus]MBW0763378.1 hypothetical protein [Mammaliicoccus lentus]